MTSGAFVALSLLRPRVMVDPFVLVALALLAGAPLALAPIPTMAAVVGVALVCRARVSRAVLVVAALAFVSSGLRARAELEHGDATHRRAVEALTPPARCEGGG